MKKAIKKEPKKDRENPYIEKLAQLGFSRAEVLIYVYLLEKGSKAAVSKISAATQIHRQQVYLTIPLLIEMGLVEELREGKVAKYKARPPQNLERIVRRKMVIAEGLAQELQKISKIGNEQDFEVVVGEQAFRNYELERSALLPIDSSQYIIGVKSDKYLNITEGIQEEYASNLKNRNIKTYYLGGEEAPKIYDSISYHFERRLLKGLKLQYMSIVISDSRIAFYGNVDPVSIYTIHSEKIADDYREFFMMLWEMAGEE